MTATGNSGPSRTLGRQPASGLEPLPTAPLFAHMTCSLANTRRSSGARRIAAGEAHMTGVCKTARLVLHRVTGIKGRGGWARAACLPGTRLGPGRSLLSVRPVFVAGRGRDSTAAPCRTAGPVRVAPVQPWRDPRSADSCCSSRTGTCTRTRAATRKARPRRNRVRCWSSSCGCYCTSRAPFRELAAVTPRCERGFRCGPVLPLVAG